MKPRRCFCTFEDRPAAWVGVKLLALSLHRHCPGAALYVYTRRASDDLRHWLQAHCPTTELRLFTPPTSSWNVKPFVLRRVLQEYDEAIWIDADALVSGDLELLFDHLPEDAFVVAEDAPRAPRAAERCAFFGRTVRRPLAHAVNSSIVRVNRRAAHLAVLECWETLLADPRYLATQRLPPMERPGPMIGDQDVLEAVLAGIAEADAPRLGPVYLLFGRTHIAPIIPDALTIRERVSLACNRARPQVIHAQGLAPWHAQHWAGLLTCAHWQLHPYVEIARTYRDLLTDEETLWMRRSSWFSRLCRRATFCDPYLQGIPLIVAGRMYHWWLEHSRRRADVPHSART